MTPAELQQVQALYDRGLYLQAHARALTIAPLEQWRGCAARILAGRLASRLGGQRLGAAQLLAALREPDADGQAVHYAAAARFRRKGPWAAWRMLARLPRALDGDPVARADRLALEAHVVAMLRDFELAHRLLGQAEALAPEHAWIQIERACVLEQQDRYEDALEVAQPLLQHDTFCGAAVAAASHLLQLLGREGEAGRLLQEALVHVESAELAAMLALIQEERGEHAAALETLARFEELAPLLDRTGRQWLAMRRADLLVRLGRHDDAAPHAEASGSAFHRALVAGARAGEGAGERLVLPVPFVRQHHRTCGPATLTALAIFHGRPTEHLQVADDICYGGTTDVNERRWALRNGFAVREFTLNAADAKTLLARGLPFAVATREATSGHLQAVIGIDERRGTFVVRDPYVRHTGEWLVDQFLEHFRACGPRAMVLAPEEEALRGVSLQDGALYDLCFQVQDALARHDHAAARTACLELAARDPEHRLTIEARCALSAYERDPVGMLSCVMRLLERYPDDSLLTMRKLGCLWELEHRDARLQLLHGLARRPFAHPAFLLQLAWTLHADAGAADEVLRLCERALRRSPTDAQGHRLRGHQLLQRGRDDEALQALRFASCLDDTDEALAHDYFEACRSRGRTPEGLQMLRERAARHGRKAGGPAQTLFRALATLHRQEEAFAVLAQALALRPDDGSLLLFAAEANASHGRLAAAAELLAAAEGRANERVRLGAAARLAARTGDLGRARECWQKALAREPLDEEARGELVRLLRAADGVEAAVGHLRAAVEEFPFHRPTRRMLAVELARVDPAASAQVLTELAAGDPLDAWVQRELALRHVDQGRFDEALAAADEAVRLQPHHAAGHGIRGFVLGRLDRRAEAEASFGRALELDVDYAPAMWPFVFGAATLPEQQAALARVGSLLESRPGNGHGLQVYAQCARRLLAPDDVLANLRGLLQRHPESWAAHTALVQQLGAMQRGDEALAAARAATGHFPLLPRPWLDLAAVHRILGNGTDEEAALERARELLPWSTEACHRLADLWCGRGEPGRAAALLRDVLGRVPDDNELRLHLCDVLLQLGDFEDAKAQASLATGLDATAEAAWRMLRTVAQRSGDAQLVGRTGRAIAERRAVAEVWLHFAGALEDPQERLQALERCLELDRGCDPAHDLRAELLALLGRADEAATLLDALAAERPLPFNLRGRRAWLLARMGRRDEAVAAMREVVAANPTYAWGLAHLVDWLSESGQHQQALAAARDLAAAAPDDPVAHACLGDALLLAARRPEGKRELALALSLAPGYEFAARRLIECHLQDGEFDEADRVVDGWLAQGPDAIGSVWRITVAGNRARAGGARPREAALAAWSDLCRDPAATGQDLAAAVQATPAAGGFLREVRALLAREVAGGRAGPPVAGAWLRAILQAGDRAAVLPALRRLAERPSCWHAAAQAVLDELGNGGGTRRRRRRRLLRSLLRSFPAELRGDDGTWGTVLFAMMPLCWRAVPDYAHDWERRPAAPPWALANLATALRCARRWDEALAVTRAALERPPDHSASRHRLWSAAEALVRGDAAVAAEHATGIDRAQITADEGLLADLVDGWCRLLLDRSQTAFAALQRALRAVAGAVSDRSAALPLRRSWPRLVRAVARDCGVGGGAPWWCWLRLRNLRRLPGR